MRLFYEPECDGTTFGEREACRFYSIVIYSESRPSQLNKKNLQPFAWFSGRELGVSIAGETYFSVLQPDQHLQQVMVPHHQNVPPLKGLVVLMNQLLLLAEPQ